MTKKRKGVTSESLVRSALQTLEQKIGPLSKELITEKSIEGGGFIVEIDFEKVLARVHIDETTANTNIITHTNGVLVQQEITPTVAIGTLYKPFSIFPFSSKDIAVFVPSEVTVEEVKAVIASQAGPLCVRLWCFDVFSKEIDGRAMTSYAFRVVFQSSERTLIEEDIVPRVEEIYTAIKDIKDWIVR